MKKEDLSRLLEEKLSAVVMQGRAMKAKDLIRNLPYDELDLANAGLSMIVAGFQIAFYHYDTVELDLLGTFFPHGNGAWTISFKPSSRLLRKIEIKGSLDLSVNGVDWESIVKQESALDDERLRDILTKVIAGVIGVTLKPAEFFSLADKMVSAWELAICDFLMREKPVQIDGIGRFAYDSMTKILFSPDPLLIRAMQAGHYRKSRAESSEPEMEIPRGVLANAMEPLSGADWNEIIRELQEMKSTIGEDTHDRFRRFFKIYKDRFQSTH